jgi:hypothetical protein
MVSVAHTAQKDYWGAMRAVKFTVCSCRHQQAFTFQAGAPFYNAYPCGILIHPMEDLCFRLSLGPLLRPGSF